MSIIKLYVDGKAPCGVLSFMAHAFQSKATVEAAATTDACPRCVVGETGSQQVITGPTTILRVLASAGNARALVGGTPAAQAEIDGWLSHVLSVATETSSSAATSLLQLINLRLLTQSFILGSSPTAVDFASYFVLHKRFAEMSAKEQLLLCNTIRWFDAVQNNVIVTSYTGDKALGTVRPSVLVINHCPVTAVLGAKAPAALRPKAPASSQAKANGKTPAKSMPKKESGTPVKGKGGQGKQQQKKKKKEKGPKKPKTPKAAPTLDFGKIDIRVGYVLKAWKNPEADKLYSEEIDVGEDKPRHIASGIWGKVELSEFEKTKVLVVCNLPAKNVPGGLKSNGMVICSCAGDKVELVRPPADAKIGEQVTIDGGTSAPAPVKWLNKKLSKYIKQFSVDDNHTVCFNGKPWMTSAGPCKSPKYKGAEVDKVG